MSLYKRGNVWWFNYVHEGKHVQRSTNQGNKNVARQMELAFHTAQVKGEFGITERRRVPTFKIAMADFLAWSEKEHQPSSHKRHRVSSVALLKHFKDVSLDKITPDEVERFKTVRGNQFTTVRGLKKRKQTDRKVRPATVNRELACLRAMFNQVIRGDVPVKNPISKTGAKSLREGNEQTRVLTFAEERKYLAAATPLLRDVAMLMLQTGMRPEEVYRIQPKDVHLSKGYLLNPYGKTKAARRKIPLSQIAMQILERRKAKCEGVYLFPHASDPSRPIPKVNNAHDRAVRDSKIAPARLYDLRHTWATRAVEADVDLVTLAAMLGHSKINMVLRYAHPSQEHQTKAMEKLERFAATQQDSVTT